MFEENELEFEDHSNESEEDIPSQSDLFFDDYEEYRR